jgi:hypothetical protein
LKSIKEDPDTKIMEAGNIFPHYLYQEFEFITRFYLFKWNQASSYGKALPYHEIGIPERLRNLQKETCKYAKCISSTLYVMDHFIFQRFVTNVQYFVKVRLINREDVLLLKTDLLAFIDYLEKLATKGVHEETGNEVSLFISDTDCDVNYSCLKSKNVKLTLFRAFVLNASVSLDEEVFSEATAWIRSMQRMSTMISVSGEKIRTTFFNSQRKVVNTL